MVSKGQFMGLDWNRITSRDAVSEFMCASRYLAV